MEHLGAVAPARQIDTKAPPRAPHALEPAAGRPAFHIRTLTLAPEAALGLEAAGRQTVWLIVEGLLRVQRISPDGRRQIINLLLPGDLVGEEMHGRPGLGIEACTEAVLCQLRLSEFQAALNRDPGLRRTEALARTVRLERLRCLTWMLGTLTAVERLTTFLALGDPIHACQPQSDGSCIVSVRLSRQDMADLLCITVESISRILHRLQDSGAIEILGPTRFRLSEAQRKLAESFVGSTLGALTRGGAAIDSWARHLGPPMTVINEAGMGKGGSSASQPDRGAR